MNVQSGSDAAVLADCIAHPDNHSWKQHSERFPELGSSSEYRDHIKSVLDDPRTEYAHLGGGQNVYYNERSNTVVVEDPRNPDGGTCYRPKDGRIGFERIAGMESGSDRSTERAAEGKANIDYGGFSKAHENDEKRREKDGSEFEPNPLTGPPQSAQERRDWAERGLDVNDPKERLQAREKEKAQFEKEQRKLDSYSKREKYQHAKERLELRAKTERNDFQRLQALDKQKYSEKRSEQVRGAADAKQAGNSYRQSVAQWHANSVGDSRYQPFENRLSATAESIRNREQEAWSSLSDRSESEGWSDAKYTDQSSKLEARLSQSRDQAFGINQGQDRGFSR